MPKGLGAKIDKGARAECSLFSATFKKTGNIPERDMFNTFNMGVGMSVIVAKEDADAALAVLRANGEDAYVIGEIVRSDEGVQLW